MRILDIVNASKSDLITVTAHQTIARAIATFEERDVGVLPVVDKSGRFVGLLSERDVVRSLAHRGRDLLGDSVEGVMRHDFPTVQDIESVSRAMRTMLERRVRHLPVLRGEQWIGLVSIGDVLKSRLTERTKENAILQDIARTRLAAVASPVAEAKTPLLALRAGRSS